jgi:hypothetical protein
MSSLPRVVSPVRTLLERDGLELALVSVELWPDEVVVRLAGMPSARTAPLEAEFETAHEEWGRRRAGGADEPPPAQPAERVFDLDVGLDDGSGTRYRGISSERGGTGTMFRAAWTFAPGVPQESSSLVVQVSFGGGPVRVGLPLED